MLIKIDQEGAQLHVAYLIRATVQALWVIASVVHSPEAPPFGLGVRQISQRIKVAAQATGLEGR